jgi:hypothetical protein
MRFVKEDNNGAREEVEERQRATTASIPSIFGIGQKRDASVYG